MFAPTVTMDKINPKDCQVKKPLVIQGFSNSLGFFQVIMANPEDLSTKFSFGKPKIWRHPIFSTKNSHDLWLRKRVVNSTDKNPAW